MKYLKTVGLCLVAALALSAVVSASASATVPHWLVCREKSGTGTKYSEDLCKTASGTGKFELIAVPEALKVTTSAINLKLRDKKAVLGKNVEVECSGTDTGTVEPEGKDKISTITVTSCTNIENCPGTVKAEARNLEWNTQLVEEGGRVKDNIRAGSGGNPGWKVTCTGVSDECTSSNGSTFMEELTNGEVSAVFKKKNQVKLPARSPEKNRVKLKVSLTSRQKMPYDSALLSLKVR